MSKTLWQSGSITAAHGVHVQTTTPERAAEPAIWLYTVQLLLAYEWILSGINKLADPNFGAELPTVLRNSTLVNPYHWYSSLLRTVMLPHASQLGTLVILGELAIGGGLALGAVVQWLRPTGREMRLIAWFTCIALLASSFLALNYSFQQGTPLPWIDSSLAFSPGMGIDMMICLLSLILLIANIRLLRAVHGR